MRVMESSNTVIPVLMSNAPNSHAESNSLGWIVAGCLDISSAFAIYLSRGIALTRGLQGIAIGLIGREAALTGGTATAALGLGLHFVIMLCVVIVFFMTSRLLPLLTLHPVISGILYGLLVYLINALVRCPPFTHWPQGRTVFLTTVWPSPFTFA